MNTNGKNEGTFEPKPRFSLPNGISPTSSSLACISHSLSSRDAARTCSCEARDEFPEGLYGHTLPRDNSGRNEAGAGRSQ